MISFGSRYVHPFPAHNCLTLSIERHFGLDKDTQRYVVPEDTSATATAASSISESMFSAPHLQITAIWRSMEELEGGKGWQSV